MMMMTIIIIIITIIIIMRYNTIPGHKIAILLNQ